VSTFIAQLSDTHFLEAGEAPEGGFAYDIGEAFDAVRADLHSRVSAAGQPLDLVAVTGDVADHGRPAQYRVAASAFSQLGAPVNVCPGNHDQHATYESLGSPTVSTSRVVRIENWCHLFVDSNAGVLQAHPTGRRTDPDDYGTRLHGNGSLGDAEAAWIAEQADATDADHVFIWLHHPPAPSVPLTDDEAYTAEWDALVPQVPNLRGLAAGHTHVPDDYEFAGLPVFVAPSLKNNFDLVGRTVLPPGYRTYRFETDGAITSDVHLVGEERWPRLQYGRAVHALMMGELNWEQFGEIVARKAAGEQQTS